MRGCLCSNTCRRGGIVTGKFLAGLIVICGLIGGAAMYYLQVYAYYDDVVPNGTSDVVLIHKDTGESTPIAYQQFKAIDAQSSPIRYRACFSTSVPLEKLRDTFVVIEDAVPLHAPGWFDCFDAEDIGDSIEMGQAVAFLSVKDVIYGIDRVTTILPDGRGFAWNRINHCGQKAFDGKKLPPDCPPPPESE